MTGRCLTVIAAGLLAPCACAVLAQPPAGKTFQATFEPGSVSGWDLPKTARLATEGGRHVLTFTGPGHAYWHAISAQEFVLHFAYRGGEATGEVILRATGEPPAGVGVRVSLYPDRVAGVRQLGPQEDELGAACFAFQKGAWHDVAITATDGRIQVGIDRQPVLSVLDSLPLPAGCIALGCCGPGGPPAYALVQLAEQPSRPPIMVPPGQIQSTRAPDLTVKKLQVVAGPTKTFPMPFVPPALLKGSDWYVKVRFELANVGTLEVAGPSCEVIGRFRTVSGKTQRAGFFTFKVTQPTPGGGVGYGAYGIPPGGPLVLVMPLRPGDVAACEGWLAMAANAPDRLRIWVVADPRNLVAELDETNNESPSVVVPIP